MTDALLLALGIACAAIGGDFFVRGVVGVARAWRVPAGIIGATVAAFATSSPELAVGLNAALAGTPEVALGDALGSNVVNLAVVLGSAIAIAGVRPDRRDVRRDLPFAVAAPGLVGLLLLDGRLSRTDGFALLLVFAVWISLNVQQARRERDATARVLAERRPPRAWAATAAGLVLLLVAGRLVVLGATGIGERLSLDPFVVGATLVAFGTSTPELAASLIARLRGHDEVAVGTAVGSNVFNSLWIVGIVAVIHPFEAGSAEIALGVGASVVSAILLIPGPSWRLPRSRGAILLVAYGSYVAATIALHRP